MTTAGRFSTWFRMFGKGPMSEIKTQYSDSSFVGQSLSLPRE
jgi:hypothetical protein